MRRSIGRDKIVNFNILYTRDVYVIIFYGIEISRKIEKQRLLLFIEFHPRYELHKLIIWYGSLNCFFSLSLSCKFFSIDRDWPGTMGEFIYIENISRSAILKLDLWYEMIG